MPRMNAVSGFLFLVIVLAGFGSAYAVNGTLATASSVVILVLAFVIALYVLRALCIASAWQRVVVLRLGKFRALRGPGLFVIVPIIDSIPYTIDIRVITSSFRAEKTLTRDTVPVDVDAV